MTEDVAATWPRRLEEALKGWGAVEARGGGNASAFGELTHTEQESMGKGSTGVTKASAILSPENLRQPQVFPRDSVVWWFMSD